MPVKCCSCGHSEKQGRYQAKRFMSHAAGMRCPKCGGNMVQAKYA